MSQRPSNLLRDKLQLFGWGRGSRGRARTALCALWPDTHIGVAGHCRQALKPQSQKEMRPALRVLDPRKSLWELPPSPSQGCLGRCPSRGSPQESSIRRELVRTLRDRNQRSRGEKKGGNEGGIEEVCYFSIAGLC